MKLAKKTVLKELPGNYTINMSNNGLIVTVHHKLDSDWDESNKVVRKMAQKFKLAEIDSGTDLYSGTRDWTFISKSLEKDMLVESKDLLKHMKAFFKKWGNTYRESTKTYDVIDTMHTMIESNEC